MAQRSNPKLSWILNLNVDSISVKLGFQIPIVSGIRGILVILHAWGGIDCKTVRIRAYSSSASSQTKGLEDWKKEIVRKIGCDRSEPNLENQVGPSRFNINYTLQVYGSFCNLYFQSKAFEVF